MGMGCKLRGTKDVVVLAYGWRVVGGVYWGCFSWCSALKSFFTQSGAAPAHSHSLISLQHRIEPLLFMMRSRAVCSTDELTIMSVLYGSACSCALRS